MEHVVDTPCFWKLELVDNGGKNLSNGEGAFSFWSELWVISGAFEISGF